MSSVSTDTPEIAERKWRKELQQSVFTVSDRFQSLKITDDDPGIGRKLFWDTRTDLHLPAPSAL
jgi:hypothetical protein